VAEFASLRLPEGEPGLQHARELLQQILDLAQARQAAIDQATSELRILKVRADSLRQWVEKAPNAGTPQWLSLVFQCRLFARLSVMQKGLVEICECGGPGGVSSQAAILRETFIAAGWQVLFAQGAESSGDQIIFSVGPGPMNHQIAAVHLALTFCGLHLHSMVNHEQSDHAVLIIPGSIPG